MKTPSPDHALRLAELMAALSLAMDFGSGHPMEWVMQSCLFAVRLGAHLGLSADDQRLVYYLSLLWHIGCTSTASLKASIFGNELLIDQGIPADSKNPLEAVRFLLMAAGKGQPVSARVRFLAQALAAGPALKDEVDRIQCEVAVLFANRLEFRPEMQAVLGHVFERWDGKGVPDGLRGEELPLPVRIVHLTQDMVTIRQTAGSDAAVALARRRANKLYDPVVVEAFCENTDELFDQSGSASLWDTILEVEPGEAIWLSDNQVETALQAVADFTDLKIPMTIGHSRAVAALAESAAATYGLPDSDITLIRRAAYIHDLGKVGISSAIWNKPGHLTESEWEQVRLHPYYTERIFSRSYTLHPLAAIAAAHHERLDGSGYHRGLRESALSIMERLLCAANAYCALTESRPYRPAYSHDSAAKQLKGIAHTGQLDRAAVDAVLSAAGHPVNLTRQETVVGLTKREIEVLRLAARGLTKREISGQLVIAEKTVDHHIQHIYNKIGVNSRAAAALFAMEHHLLIDR